MGNIAFSWVCLVLFVCLEFIVFWEAGKALSRQRALANLRRKEFYGSATHQAKGSSRAPQMAQSPPGCEKHTAQVSRGKEGTADRARRLRPGSL